MEGDLLRLKSNAYNFQIEWLYVRESPELEYFLQMVWAKVRWAYIQPEGMNVGELLQHVDEYLHI